MSTQNRTLGDRTTSWLDMQVSSRPRVCVLFGTTRGDNAQLLTLARALNWPFEVKGEVDGVPMTVVDRLAHAMGVRLRRRKPLLSSLLWPDLILVTGGRRVIDALRIKTMSGGRSRIVCVGRPWADLDLFDLVITTPQYRLPERQNVLMNAMPLNRPDEDALSSAADEWRSEIAHLPKPWMAVLVGGNSGSCRFTEAAAERLAVEANRFAQETGGSLLISTSGRTPNAAADALFRDIDAPHVGYRFDKAARRNPHLAFLALADRFVVTSDSASMIAEAVSTGRPTSIFDVPLRRRSRWMTRPKDPNSMGDRLRRYLTVKGLWVPARDMNAYHRTLTERGYLVDRDQPDRSAPQDRQDDLERALDAIHGLFPGLQQQTIMPSNNKRERALEHGLAIAG